MLELPLLAALLVEVVDEFVAVAPPAPATPAVAPPAVEAAEVIPLDAALEPVAAEEATVLDAVVTEPSDKVEMRGVSVE